MGKFVIKQRTNGDYQFNLKATNGQIILSSEGYATKQGCNNGINSVKNNAPYDERYEKKTSKDGSYYFNLQALNGQVIGTSEMYSSESARDNGISSVQTNAPYASVEDTTL